MDNIIIIAVITLILGFSISKLIKAKASGVKCIGCPDAPSCASKKHTVKKESSCGCCGEEAHEITHENHDCGCGCK